MRNTFGMHEVWNGAYVYYSVNIMSEMWLFHSEWAGFLPQCSFDVRVGHAYKYTSGRYIE